jgi:hypothetical protein
MDGENAVVQRNGPDAGIVLPPSINVVVRLRD